MPDPQLAALAKHFQRMAVADREQLAIDGHPQALVNAPTPDAAGDLARRVALWEQLASEIESYLAGTLVDISAGTDEMPMFDLYET